MRSRQTFWLLGSRRASLRSASPGTRHGDAQNAAFFFDLLGAAAGCLALVPLLRPRDIPKIAAAPLPNGPWNVRNFGWSPLLEGDVGGTVSRRTAAETQAVVQFINAKLLTK